MVDLWLNLFLPRRAPTRASHGGGALRDSGLDALGDKLGLRQRRIRVADFSRCGDGAGDDTGLPVLSRLGGEGLVFAHRN